MYTVRHISGALMLTLLYIAVFTIRGRQHIRGVKAKHGRFWGKFTVILRSACLVL